MLTPTDIRISEFDYDLPDEKIAAYPLPQRDQSKLLIYKKGAISQGEFRTVSRHLPPGSMMIFNDTKVLEARILFKKPTGARVEIFCLEPADEYPDISTALARCGNVNWKCMVGRASSWTHQAQLEKKLPGGIFLYAKVLQKKSDHFLIHLSWVPEKMSFAEILHLAGETPLPPYIKRRPDATDVERYQTIYAHHEGSVAAPTAGLHFTPAVMEELNSILTDINFVTLHVGAGTFKPVKSDDISQHEMHSEYIEVTRALVEKIINRNLSNIIAVGTTSLRTLESLYWIGVKIHQQPGITARDLCVQQWEPYQQKVFVPLDVSMKAILSFMNRENMLSLITKTSLLIAPSYDFRVVDILITNFHQPRSTLLLLVAAFIGNDWKSVYSYAVDNDFRFLSYGDSCLLFRK
jgi:S-adenosylmethionine:tRNA ribosyltransferase-isomerase